MEYRIIERAESLLLMDDLVTCGTKAFWMFELDSACERYNISTRLKRTLEGAYGRYGDKYVVTLSDVIKSPHSSIRSALAVFGDDDIRESLLYDGCYKVRANIAKHGTTGQRRVLIRDVHWFVRFQVACYGTENMKYTLLEDVEWMVRGKAQREVSL